MTRGTLAALVLGLGLRLAGAAEVPADCPGYVAHLRSARVHLVHGDRQAAATELREARKALDACARREPPGDAIARR